MVSFEWDKGNLNKNFKKHKVANQEAEEIFTDEASFIFEDKTHSTDKEKHYGIFGKTGEGRLLSIVFTLREEKIRIISARDISKKERRSYEKIKSNS